MANSSITIINPAASSGQVTTGTATNVVVTPAVMKAHLGMAKWWVYLTGGSTTITTSYGVTSITSVSTGISTINFAFTFSSGTGYLAVATGNTLNSSTTGLIAAVNNATATSINIRTSVGMTDVVVNATVGVVGFSTQS